MAAAHARSAVRVPGRRPRRVRGACRFLGRPAGPGPRGVPPPRALWVPSHAGRDRPRRRVWHRDGVGQRRAPRRPARNGHARPHRARRGSCPFRPRPVPHGPFWPCLGPHQPRRGPYPFPRPAGPGPHQPCRGPYPFPRLAGPGPHQARRGPCPCPRPAAFGPHQSRRGPCPFPRLAGLGPHQSRRGQVARPRGPCFFLPRPVCLGPNQSHPGRFRHRHGPFWLRRRPNRHGHRSNRHGHRSNRHGHRSNRHGHRSNRHGHDRSRLQVCPAGPRPPQPRRPARSCRAAPSCRAARNRVPGQRRGRSGRGLRRHARTHRRGVSRRHGAATGPPWRFHLPGLSAGPTPSQHAGSQQKTGGRFSEAAPSEVVRRRPTLPRGPPRSTIGAEGLNFRVRNGTGCFPFAMATETLWRCGAPTASREPHSGRVHTGLGVTSQTGSCRSQATRPISTGQLHVSPRFHLRPINPVV